MAQIVAAMAMTHSPGLTGWFERAPEEQQKHALRATAEMRERLIAARPDVIVAFSNDHLLNWPINNTPEYTVGIGAEHVGPADWYDEWLGMPTKYRIPGHPDLARFMVNESVRRRLSLAYLRAMEFDDGISVPMHFLNPEGTIALVPVTMNCTVPPVPTPERAYQVGTILRDVLKAYPASGVALLRIMLGTIFVMHGWYAWAILGPSDLTDLMLRVGNPPGIAALLAWYTIGAHLVGGLLLIIGFLTPWAALGQVPITAG